MDKNNERPDWMTDLKHTDSAWSGILLIIDLSKNKGKKRGGEFYL